MENKDNAPIIVRSQYVAGEGRTLFNHCRIPRQHNHRNEYALHDMDCKVYDDDLRVIEFANDL